MIYSLEIKYTFTYNRQLFIKYNGRHLVSSNYKIRLHIVYYLVQYADHWFEQINQCFSVNLIKTSHKAEQKKVYPDLVCISCTITLPTSEEKTFLQYFQKILNHSIWELLIFGKASSRYHMHHNNFFNKLTTKKFYRKKFFVDLLKITYLLKSFFDIF